MPEGKKTYKVGETLYDIGSDKVDAFLADFPNAQEQSSFIVGRDTFDIPVDKAEAFLTDFPDAKPTFGVEDEPKKKDGQGVSSPSLTEPSASEGDPPQIQFINANLPQAATSPIKITNPVSTVGQFLEYNQATPSDLGFNAQINKDIPLTQQDVDKYNQVLMNNRMYGAPEQAPSDFDIAPVLKKTTRQRELQEMDDGQKKREYLATRVLDESVLGKITKPVIGSIVGITKEERLDLDKLAGMVKDPEVGGYDPNTLQDVAAGLLTIMADTPIFAGLGSVMKIPAAASARLVASGLTKLKASEAVISGMVKVAQAAPSMAGVLGGHAAINELEEQVINQGKTFTGDGDEAVDWERVAKVGGQQAVLGATIGTIGAGTGILANSPKVTGVINNKILREGTKAAIQTTGIVAESAAFAYGPAILDREQSLKDVTKEDFLHSLATIVGLKAMHLPKRVPMREKPTRVKTEAEVESLRKHVAEGDVVEVAKADSKVADAIMNDPNVPWVAKAEIAQQINGLNPALWEPPLRDVKMIENPNGTFDVTSFDVNGGKIDVAPFKSKQQALDHTMNVKRAVDENNMLVSLESMDVEQHVEIYKYLDELGYREGLKYESIEESIQTPDQFRTEAQREIMKDVAEAVNSVTKDAVKPPAEAPKKPTEPLSPEKGTETPLKAESAEKPAPEVKAEKPKETPTPKEKVAEPAPKGGKIKTREAGELDVTVEKRDEDGGKAFRVVAKDKDGNVVARVDVGQEGDVRYVKQAETAKDSRRKGVMTAMYDFIEKQTGKPLEKTKFTIETAEGKAFREARDKVKETPKEQTDAKVESPLSEIDVGKYDRFKQHKDMIKQMERDGIIKLGRDC